MAVCGVAPEGQAAAMARRAGEVVGGGASPLWRRSRRGQAERMAAVMEWQEVRRG